VYRGYFTQKSPSNLLCEGEKLTILQTNADPKNDQTNRLLKTLTTSTDPSHHYLAIGLDIAAAEDNWGLTVLQVDKQTQVANVRIMLPQAAERKGGVAHKSKFCRPSLQLLGEILKWAREEKILCSLAVDVPFGWPNEHLQFIQNWSASSGWKIAQSLPQRSSFQFRLCDIEFEKYFKPQKVTPLSVSADTLAQAAFQWALARNNLEEQIGTIDFGLIEKISEEGTVCFETYPGAFVRVCYPNHYSYKSASKRDVRVDLLSSLDKDYPVEMSDSLNQWRNWACNQAGSPDAIDSYLCAICAWEHLRIRYASAKTILSTPVKILGRSPTEEEKSKIEREGWILIPCPRS
jgi:hypothetical protein